MKAPTDLINISDIPTNIKKWKSLSEYNQQWEFISNDSRYRISESLAALDYFASIYDWLKPGLVFADVHKRMILILVASIYECVLTDAISRTARQELAESKILKLFIKKDKINEIDNDEFESLINNGQQIGMYRDDWKEYLHKIRGVRNWIHLSKNRDKNLEKWFNEQPIESFKSRLEDFRKISEVYLSTIWA
jgi:hypothetical protein